MLAHGLFKQALSCFPTGVTLVTTTDSDERNWGFTASAFSALSLDPPLVLVCLSRSADCCSAFTDTKKFGVSILRREHEALARRFATKGQDKFAGGEFLRGNLGVPVLPDALAVLECTMDALVSAGDHNILIGLVTHARVQDGHAAIYFKGDFHSLIQPQAVDMAAAEAISGMPAGELARIANIGAYSLA
jgi:flavin reductase ActVB